MSVFALISQSINIGGEAKCSNILLCCHPVPALLMGFQGQHVIPNAQIRSLMKFCSKKLANLQVS